MVNSKEYLDILGLLYLIVHYLYNKTNVGTLLCVYDYVNWELY